MAKSRGRPQTAQEDQDVAHHEAAKLATATRLQRQLRRTNVRLQKAPGSIGRQAIRSCKQLFLLCAPTADGWGQRIFLSSLYSEWPPVASSPVESPFS